MDPATLERLKELAWRKSSIEFNDFLDVKEIYVPLNSRNYFTRPQREELLNHAIDSYTKINRLLEWMPTKGGNWFADFVSALNETKNGTGHANIIEALQKNLHEVAKENYPEISQEIIDSKVATIFGSTFNVVKEVNPIQVVADQQQKLDFQPPQQPDPMSRRPFVNHRNMTIDMLNEEYENKRQKIQSSGTAATRKQLNEKVAGLRSYSILIEVVNDIEFKTAICQMDGEICSCTVCDDLTNSESIYVYGKWGNVPVVVVKTGTKVGSQFQYGSWFETKKALYYMPELKHVFGVGVCGAAVDVNSGDPCVPLGHVVISSHIIGYDHQKKKDEGDENRGFSSDMSQHSFYQFLFHPLQKGEWEQGLRFGRVLSGSWLVADIKAQELVLDSSQQDEIAFEMEGVGIAAACQNTKFNMLVIKGVSDYANRDKSDAWQPAAARNATRYLSEMINKRFPPVEP